GPPRRGTRRVPGPCGGRGGRGRSRGGVPAQRRLAGAASRRETTPDRQEIDERDPEPRRTRHPVGAPGRSIERGADAPGRSAEGDRGGQRRRLRARTARRPRGPRRAAHVPLPPEGRDAGRDRVPARTGQIECSGAREARGVAPIGEIGVGEVVPVRIGVKPKGTGSVPVAVGITYKRLFDENRYEVRDTKEIRVEPESTYL